MATLVFAGRLRNYVTSQQRPTDKDTLRLALEQIFLKRPLLRSYILDDQGTLRRGLWIFINGWVAENTEALDCPLTPNTTVYIRERLG
jgi:hypothetical protein